MFGFNLSKVRKGILELMKSGIEYAFHNANDFFDVIAEFIHKMNKKDQKETYKETIDLSKRFPNKNKINDEAYKRFCYSLKSGKAIKKIALNKRRFRPDNDIDYDDHANQGEDLHPEVILDKICGFFVGSLKMPSLRNPREN
jgi:aspartyl/asparaginyl-tRNA synthetase